MSTEDKSFAVLPTADAPTAEQMHLALDSAIGRAISADTVKVLSWVNAHLPSLIAADADRQRWDLIEMERAKVQCDGGDFTFKLHIEAGRTDTTREMFDACMKQPLASRSPEGAPNDA